MGLDWGGAAQVTGPEWEDSGKLLSSSPLKLLGHREEERLAHIPTGGSAGSQAGQLFLLRVDGPLRAPRTLSSGHRSKCTAV